MQHFKCCLSKRSCGHVDVRIDALFVVDNKARNRVSFLCTHTHNKHRNIIIIIILLKLAFPRHIIITFRIPATTGERGRNWAVSSGNILILLLC